MYIAGYISLRNPGDLGIEYLLTSEVPLDKKKELGIGISLDNFKSFTTIILLSGYLHRVSRNNGESSPNDNAYFSDESKDPLCLIFRSKFNK